MNIFVRSISIILITVISGAFGRIDIQLQNVLCDLGPNSLSEEMGTSIPRTCIYTDTGIIRCFFTYIPECASGNTPVVYDIHGINGCPARSARKTRWKEMADEKCFVVVWPTGNVCPETSDLSCWHVPGGLTGLAPDPEAITRPCCCFRSDPVTHMVDPDDTRDLRFLRSIASYVVRDVPILTNNTVTIDTKRIYMGGRSNGCIAAYSMAMQHSDLVAAVCCKSGALLTPPAENYTPVPIWTVHGNGDILIPYDGLTFGSIAGTLFNGVSATFQYLSKLNGCNATESKATDDGEVQKSTACRRGADIQLRTIDGARHFETYGMGSYQTSESAWEFCSAYESNVEPVLDPIPELSTVQKAQISLHP